MPFVPPCKGVSPLLQDCASRLTRPCVKSCKNASRLAWVCVLPEMTTRPVLQCNLSRLRVTRVLSCKAKRPVIHGRKSQVILRIDGMREVVVFSKLKTKQFPSAALVVKKLKHSLLPFEAAVVPATKERAVERAGESNSEGNWGGGGRTADAALGPSALSF